MYLIAGLGNPDKKYENTRHNVGFMTIDTLAEKLGVAVTTRKFKAFCGQGMIGSEKVLLMKPQTYMNLSGEAIREAADFYQIPPEQIIVVCDDVYLELGSIRIRKSGSAGGHNGLKNIIAHLKSEEFKRFRLGVGMQPEGMPLEVFVLKQMTSGERKVLSDTLLDAADALMLTVSENIDKAMNRYNGKRNGDGK